MKLIPKFRVTNECITIKILKENVHTSPDEMCRLAGTASGKAARERDQARKNRERREKGSSFTSITRLTSLIHPDKQYSKITMWYNPRAKFGPAVTCG